MNHRSTLIKDEWSVRRFAALACVLLVVSITGCTAPEPDQNDNTNNGNDNSAVQLDGFPFDVELGRSGTLALPTQNCSAEVVSTTTGSGTFESSVITSETVAQPYIHMQVSAPKGTEGGVIITDCGLLGRFAITPGDSGATTATADLTASVRLDADQNGESAGGYQIMVGLSLIRVSTTDPDTSVGEDFGLIDRSYCMLPLTCTEPLPVENGFVGVERFGLGYSNIELQANAEYIVSISMGGSIVSSEGSPDLLGGSIIARATVESLQLTFNSDDQDDE